MHLLINASNIKQGGGLQVVDSICGQLDRFGQHVFYVVLSSSFAATADKIKDYKNVKVFRHDITHSLRTLVFGRDAFLDKLVDDYEIDCVLTVFGPSRWNPRVSHVSGFARSQLVPGDSPYFRQLNLFEQFCSKIYCTVINWAFKRSTNVFYTENEYISRQLRQKWDGCTVDTITNYYHQVFDDPAKWNRIDIPAFDGVSILTIASNYPHKNLKIAVDVAKYLRKKYPDFKFRFIYTLRKDEIRIPEELEEHFHLCGKVDISQCPVLYAASDIAFQPTLLECFTATYPEAMKMGKPIVTTDLEFARGLCKDASLFFDPLDARDAAEKIHAVAMNPELAAKLVANGKRRLQDFDDFTKRTSKLIALCEKTVTA